MNQDSGSALFSLDGPPLVRLGPGADPEGLQERAERHGWRCAVLDGRKMPDKRGMLEEIARGLAFPDYFGWNWDALEECLAEPDVMGDASGCLLVIGHAADAERGSPEDYKTLVSILEDASRSWREQSPALAFKTVVL